MNIKKLFTTIMNIKKLFTTIMNIKKLFTTVLLYCLLGITQTSTASERINFIVPAGPGSASHILAENLAVPIRAAGFEVVIILKNGARGIIAAEFARKEKSTTSFLVLGGGIAKFEAILNKDFQSLLDDYQFIGPVLSTVFVLATTDPTITSAKDIFDNNKVFTVASPNSVTKHIITTLNAKYPDKFIEVSYKDSNLAWIDFIGGHVQLDVERVTWFADKNIPKVKIIGNTTLHQFRSHSSLSAFVPGIDIKDNATGLMARRDAPEELVTKIESILYSHYQQAEVRKKLIAEGYTLIENTNRSHNVVLIKEISQKK